MDETLDERDDAGGVREHFAHRPRSDRRLPRGRPGPPDHHRRIYNADNPAPYPQISPKAASRAEARRAAAKTTLNELRFEDKKGEEELHMQAEKNMSTPVKNDQSTSVIASRSGSVGGSDSVSVGGDRSVSVNGNLSVTVKGGGKGPTHWDYNVTAKHSLNVSDTIATTAKTSITLTQP
jgi:uncharacterized protein involved in type VI secretion and phage assembly